jgi:hypothetical protein
MVFVLLRSYNFYKLTNVGNCGIQKQQSKLLALVIRQHQTFLFRIRIV